MEQITIDITEYCELVKKLHRYNTAMRYAKNEISALPLKRLCSDPEFRALAVEQLGEPLVHELEYIVDAPALRHWSLEVDQARRHGLTVDTCMGPTRAVPGVHFIYAFSGSFLITTPNEAFTLEQGQTAVFDIDAPHGVAAQNDKDIPISLLLYKPYLTEMLGTKTHAHPLFNEFYSKTFYPDNEHRGYLVFDTAQDESFRHYFSKALYEFTFERPFSLDAVDICISEILVTLMRAYTLFFERGSTRMPLTDQIRAILDYIDRNLQDVTLASAAREFHFSTNHLSRVVKQQTGCTFLDLVHKARLREATYLLRTPELTVSEVSRLVGYNNVSYFYKLFYRQYQMTPNDYRDSFGRYSEKFRTRLQEMDDTPFLSPPDGN